VLDILVPEIRLQSPRIMAFVRQREAAGVPEHVWMRLEAEPGRLTSTFHKLGKPAGGERRAPLGCEHERQFRLLLALQFP